MRERGGLGGGGRLGRTRLRRWGRGRKSQKARRGARSPRSGQAGGTERQACHQHSAWSSWILLFAHPTTDRNSCYESLKQQNDLVDWFSCCGGGAGTWGRG